MAEEESELELDRLRKEFNTLPNTGARDDHGFQSMSYCARFCKLVVEQTGRWQVPFPQLQVLRSALCSFVQDSGSFPSDCEHVSCTISSLALSIFELLLFFAKDEFIEHPLKDILDSFQDCCVSLVRHQNVYLQQVKHIIKQQGPWANPVLQAILTNSEPPEDDVNDYLSSEITIFFELRVRYLMACERFPEALALAKSCVHHSVLGKHLYFKQAYLICLWRTSRLDILYEEVANIDVKDAVEILCMAETEEKGEVVLILTKLFLGQKLQTGDMYCIWNLIFIWSKIYLRLKHSTTKFLEECKTMVMSSTDIKAIFPFMKVILSEIGREGLSFCVELCALALQTDLKDNPQTEALIYKTIAYLLPNDLEVCRACALLVFFLERTVDSYKTVFLLYSHPDQEYHADQSLVENPLRFDVLQILKKSLYFDPEFWSLSNIETNCLDLMSDKVAKATCEMMQKDKWLPSYCTKGECCCRSEELDRRVDKHSSPIGLSVQSQILCTRPNEMIVQPSAKRRGRKPGTLLRKDPELCPVRRSFRQLDLAKINSRRLNSRHQRLLARQADMSTVKRRGRKPLWLVNELIRQGEYGEPRQGKKPGRKPKQSSISSPANESTVFSYPDNEVHTSCDDQVSPDLPPVIERVTETTTSQDTLDHWSECFRGPFAESKDDVWITDEVFSDQALSMVQRFHTYSSPPVFEGSSVGTCPINREVNGEGIETTRVTLVNFPKDSNIGVHCQDNQAVLCAQVSVGLTPDETPLTKTDPILASHRMSSSTEPSDESVSGTGLTDAGLNHSDASQVVSKCSGQESVENINLVVESPTAETISPREPSDETCKFSVVCSLCNKEVKNLHMLRHALWHHRLDKKCMFCHKQYSHGRIPSVHFKLHIQELKKSSGLHKENICKGNVEQPEAPTECTQTRLSHVPPESCSRPRRSRFAKCSDPPSTAEDRKMVRVKRKRFLTSSESVDENRKLFKMRLVRKRSKDVQSLNPEESLSHRVNGGNRKRRTNMNSNNEKTQNASTDSEEEEFGNSEIRSERDKNGVKSKVYGRLFDHRNIARVKMNGEHGDKRPLNSSLKTTMATGEHEENGMPAKTPENCLENLKPKENTTRSTESIATRPKKWTACSTTPEAARTGPSTHVKCPVEICTFNSKASAVLSHVLSHHHGDKKALLFFFTFGKEKCLFCCRKIFNPQHFLDHVMHHRGELKYPCYHYGCKQRFQTRIELGEHVLGHHPLRVMCCFPGCSVENDNMMHLYRHEKTHYVSSIVEADSLSSVSEPVTTSDGLSEEGKALVQSRQSPVGGPALFNGRNKSEKALPSKKESKGLSPFDSGKPKSKHFIRPLPSMYLDESYISMPKRRKEPKVSPRMLEEVSTSAAAASPCQQRCPRCFRSFSSEEQLQEHKDTCTSLFGFDSDDESAW